MAFHVRPMYKSFAVQTLAQEAPDAVAHRQADQEFIALEGDRTRDELARDQTGAKLSIVQPRSLTGQ
jgi:hypothetical protein